MGQHFYDIDGKPCHRVTGSNGKERDTNLRDARKLNLVASVTAFLQIPKAGRLNDWIVEQHILAAWNYKKELKVTDMGAVADNYDAFKAAIVKEAGSVTKSSSEEGSRVHAALEGWYRSQFANPEYEKHIAAVDKVIKQSFGDLPWCAEDTFNYKGLFGGSVDLHSKKGDGVVLDFKTKDKDNLAELVYYEKDKNIGQLAAYRQGLELPNACIGNVYVSTRNPGEVHLVIYSEEEAQRGWEMFKCLCKYWHIEKKVTSAADLESKL